MPRPLLTTNMVTVFIFHGIYGHSKENWFPWMKQQLERDGYDVVVPDFPNADRPKLEEWIVHMDQYKPLINKHTILIGHSLGASFLLRFLEHSKQTVHSSFLVAPVWCVMGNEFDPLMTTFTQAPYDWKTIKKNCKQFDVIYSNDDPYIQPSLSKELSKKLGAKSLLIKGAGHMNEKAGYLEFEVLLEKLNSVL